MKKNNLKYILFSLLSFMSFYKYISMYIKNIITMYILYILLFIIFFIIYYKLYDNIKLDKKYKVFILIMSFIIVLGYSYEIKSTGILFFGSIKNLLISSLKVTGFYFFLEVIVYYFLEFMQKKSTYNSKIASKFSKHPFLYSFVFLTICYGLLLCLYYPGIINYDNANQIKEVMGIHNRYLDAINPIDGSTLTNFNPIVHTLMIGGLFKIGYLIGNVNFGLFLYTIIQMFIVITIYSYAISYSIKEKIKPIYSLVILIIIGLIPLFGYYSITGVKDTLYTVFLLLFSIRVYDFIKKEQNQLSDYLLLLLSSILVCLFRNNGFYVVILTIPFMIYKNKKVWILLLIMLFAHYSFNNIILVKLKVSQTSIREALSVPFQQTARLVKYKDNEIDSNDKIIISKILDYDNMAKDYNEDLADPVKNKFNKDYTNKELMNYFGVWFKYLFKYPSIYVDATINNITSYFYPFEGSWKVYHKLNRKLPEAGFDYHFNKLEEERILMHNYELFIENSPLGLILNIAILTWLSILIFISLLKNKKYIFLIPNIISILFCVLSPANTYFRYIYPTLILLILMFPLIKKSMESEK